MSFAKTQKQRKWSEILMLEHVVAWMADELPKIPKLSSLNEKCNDVFTDDSSTEKSKKQGYQLQAHQSSNLFCQVQLSRNIHSVKQAQIRKKLPEGGKKKPDRDPN